MSNFRLPESERRILAEQHARSMAAISDDPYDKVKEALILIKEEKEVSGYVLVAGAFLSIARAHRSGTLHPPLSEDLASGVEKASTFYAIDTSSDKYQDHLLPFEEKVGDFDYNIAVKLLEDLVAHKFG